MIKRTIRKYLSKFSIYKKLDIIIKNNDNQLILMGRQLSEYNKKRVREIINNIHLSEFQIFSQWADDGIIQFLINYLDIDKKKFIEFGIENYREANTRFLLINNNWSGLVMDYSKINIKQLQTEDIYWKYDLKAVSAFVTKDNINSLLEDNGFTGEIGLLHIDIDGNDYWIWKEINVISPIIVIVEYNSIFGINNPWTIPYSENFNRTSAHYSNLYFGSSILSLCDLGEAKGYYFIGSNSNGNNAYFIRKDKIKELIPLSAEEGYVTSMFRESRNMDGKLTYLSGDERLNEIEDMDVYNTLSEQIERIKTFAKKN